MDITQTLLGKSIGQRPKLIHVPELLPGTWAWLCKSEHKLHSNQVSVRQSVFKWQKWEVGKNNKLPVVTFGESLLRFSHCSAVYLPLALAFDALHAERRPRSSAFMHDVWGLRNKIHVPRCGTGMLLFCHGWIRGVEGTGQLRQKHFFADDAEYGETELWEEERTKVVSFIGWL